MKPVEIIKNTIVEVKFPTKDEFGQPHATSWEEVVAWMTDALTRA